MERDYSYAVLIGRFQPLHNSHVKLLEYAFKKADKVIVLVGSANAAPSPKNPFTFKEREEMLHAAFPETVKDDSGLTTSTEHWGRLIVLPIRDYFYSDSVWTAQVQAVTSEYIQEGDSVALMGAYTDASSYYLNMFPQWEFVATPMMYARGSSLDATLVREKLFDIGKVVVGWPCVAQIKPEVTYAQDNWFSHNVPKTTAEFLERFRESPRFVQMAEEFLAIKKHKESWASAPYPPIFVTADAVVTCAGHILVVKRGGGLGKGLFALPGGFIREGERIQEAAIRELKEEARIRVDYSELHSSVVDSKVFDHPDRSLRGRTITHAYHIKLNKLSLPEVRHGSDAAGVFWLPLMDVNRLEEKFFEDHAHIINFFINKS